MSFRGLGHAAACVVLAACADDDPRPPAGDSSSGSVTTIASDDMGPAVGTSEASSETDGASGGTTSTVAATDASTLDASSDGTIGSTDSGAGSTGGAGSTTGDATCEEDEPEPHSTPATALELSGLDCDDPPIAGMGVLDTASGLDWWSFQGIDPEGGCEPDSVRIEAMVGFQITLCAFTEGCSVVCLQGVPDADDGCCGPGVVELSVDCSGPDDGDDSTSVTFLLGSGFEECLQAPFEYEF